MKYRFYKSTIFIVIMSMFLGTIISEAFVRIFSPQELGSVLNIYRSDEILKYRYQTERQTRQSTTEFDVIIQTNSEGMRDQEYKHKKENGEYRVLVVGDSFSFGHGVDLERIYPKLLEKHMNTSIVQSNSQTSYHVINAAVGGYHPEQYYKMMVLYANKLEIDSVIVGFYIGNDFRLYDETSEAILQDGYLLGYKNTSIEKQYYGKERIREIIRPIRTFLGTKSHLYVLLRKALYPILYRLELVQPRHVRNLDNYKSETSQDTRNRFAQTETLVRAFAEFSKENSTPIMFLLIPDRIQVYDDVWSESVGASNLDHSEVNKYNPNRKLGQILMHEGIEFIDLLPLMRELEHQQLYFHKDGHWTAAGHALAADALLVHLQPQFQ